MRVVFKYGENVIDIREVNKVQIIDNKRDKTFRIEAANDKEEFYVTVDGLNHLNAVDHLMYINLLEHGYLDVTQREDVKIDWGGRGASATLHR